VKHSGASEVHIRLVLGENSFELTVEDNGRGYAINQAVPAVSRGHGRLASGNGLENMVRRLAAIGGSCDIQSFPGTGTKVVFRMRLAVETPSIRAV